MKKLNSFKSSFKFFEDGNRNVSCLESTPSSSYIPFLSKATAGSFQQLRLTVWKCGHWCSEVFKRFCRFSHLWTIQVFRSWGKNTENEHKASGKTLSWKPLDFTGGECHFPFFGESGLLGLQEVERKQTRWPEGAPAIEGWSLREEKLAPDI